MLNKNNCKTFQMEHLAKTILLEVILLDLSQGFEYVSELLDLWLLVFI